MAEENKKVEANNEDAGQFSANLFNEIEDQIKKTAQERTDASDQVVANIDKKRNEESIIKALGNVALQNKAKQDEEKRRRLLATVPANRREEFMRRLGGQVNLQGETISTSAARQKNDEGNSESSDSNDNDINSASQIQQQAAMQQQAALESYREQLRQYYRAKLERLKAITSVQREKADLDGFTIMIVMFAFIIAIVTDFLDIIEDASVVGAFLSSIMSICADIALGILWWSVGVGSLGRFGDINDMANSKLGKRMIAVDVGEFVPYLNALPFYTFLCVWNLLDLLGYVGGSSSSSSNSSGSGNGVAA